MKVLHADNKVESASGNADSKAQRPAARPMANNNPADDKSDARPREIGGRDDNSPDPTRFGDWEKAGRCIDF